MLILKTVAQEPLPGYGIGVRIEQISKGVFEVGPGSLFPALRRLERSGLIAAKNGSSATTTVAPNTTD
jgi:PadR family transcriptional regulator PadR